jgi:hypothetical protein
MILVAQLESGKVEKWKSGGSNALYNRRHSGTGMKQQPSAPENTTSWRRTFCRIASSVAPGALVVQSPETLLAHHSASLSDFDAQHPVTLVGTVAEFRLVNPHSSIAFDVKDEKGHVRRWHVELGSSAALSRAGWTAETLKPGQGIKVVAAPAKDGSPAVSAQHEARITLTDTNAVIYDAGRPVWLSVLRLFRS